MREKGHDGQKVGGSGRFRRKRAAKERAALGRDAEERAAAYLRERGYEVIGRNVRVGRLEIDIIARRGSLLVFCEVRCRTDQRWMTAAQSIGPDKVARVRRAAAQWLASSKASAREIRFDAACVVYDVAGGRIEYFEAAF